MKKILIYCVIAFSFWSCKSEIHTGATPKRGFHSDRPAKIWEESLVSGNGIMGAMVIGDPYQESIVLNHALLYLPIHSARKPVGQGKYLGKIQQMLLEDKYMEASQFVVDLANSEGYKGKHATDLFIPAFQFNLLGDTSTVKQYERSVDFTSGEVIVNWEDNNGVFTRKLFVSRPDNLVVLKFSSDEGASINTTLSLSKIIRHDVGRIKKFNLDDNFCIKKVESGTMDNGLYFKAWYERPWEFESRKSFKGYEGVVQVLRSDGKIEMDSDRLILRDATDVLIVARIEPSDNMEESRVLEMSNALKSYDGTYDELLAVHKKIHKELFERVSIDLDASEEDRMKSSEELLKLGGSNPALVEKLFDAARYNVISATGINPPNLQGIWGATMTPPWSGDYTTNGNLPVVVSHYLQANTPELMLPLFDRLEAYMEDFKVNARELFNCQGIHVPSRFSSHGLNNHFDATWPMTFWLAGAAWYSLFYYDYYMYTLDKDFLRERALPFMEQAALFYEDFLKEGNDGKYIFNPSYSPENNPANSSSQACVNATMDVMAANGLLHSVIEASQILGVNQDKIPVWKAMQEKMPSYMLNENGEIREWMWKDLQDNHKHRHASHLFGLYDFHDPLIMGNQDLIEGCKRAINRRMEIRRQDNGGIMAFGMVQLAFAACALGETEMAYDMLVWLGNSYWNNNLVSTHDPKKTFNLDICGGYPSLVMKMMVYSEPGVISLLPCKPVQWKNGTIKGIALRGGILLQELVWHEKEVKATLLSKINQTVKIQLQGIDKQEIALKAGEPVTVVF